MQKVLMVVLGGIADHAVEGLGRRTPLQVARTPNLDHLAMLGGCGLYHPTVLGQPVMPDYALYLMLGNPPELYPGRASFEAIARGVRLEEERVYFLAEPAFVDRNVLVETRTFQSEDEEESFFRFLKGRVEGVFRLDRGLYLFKAEHYVPCNHPGIVGGCLCSDVELPELSLLPEQWQGNVARIERGLQPLNRLLFFGCGRYVPNREDGFPVNSLFYTDSTFFTGMARWMGKEVIYEPSKEMKSWLMAAFNRALKELEKRDMVFIYTDYIHRMNIQTRAWRRVEVIEEMDSAFGVLLEAMAREDIFLVITSDTTVPSIGHRPCSGLPVPVVMMGEGVRRGGVGRFDEALAASGSLGMMRGKELLLTIFSYTGYFCSL